MGKPPQSDVSQHLKNLEVYGYSHIPSFLSGDIVSHAKNLVDQNYHDFEDLEAVGRPDAELLARVWLAADAKGDQQGESGGQRRT